MTLSVDQATPAEDIEAVPNAEGDLKPDPPEGAGEGDIASVEDVKVVPIAEGNLLPDPAERGWRKGS